MRKVVPLLATVLLATGLFVAAETVLPHEFGAGDLLSADAMNENFAALAGALDALAAGKQERVADGCPAGASIQRIAADGSVACHQDQLGDGPVAWSSIEGIPEGFADDVDDDTTYQAGAGLALDRTTLSVAFGGDGRSDEAARSDHLHDDRYPTDAEVAATVATAIAGLDVGLEQVSSQATFSASVGGGGGFGLSCPVGKEVLGAGWDIDAGGVISIVENRPQSASSWFLGFRVVLDEDQTPGVAGTIVGWLICADLG